MYVFVRGDRSEKINESVTLYCHNGSYATDAVSTVARCAKEGEGVQKPGITSEIITKIYSARSNHSFCSTT
jgi:hypothetical protein